MSSVQQSTPDGTQLTQTPGAGGSNATTQQQQQPSRAEMEEARKDRTLAEFLLMLDDYEPLVCFVAAIPERDCEPSLMTYGRS
jgi:hypothetical protein